MSSTAQADRYVTSLNGAVDLSRISVSVDGLPPVASNLPTACQHEHPFMHPGARPFRRPAQPRSGGR